MINATSDGNPVIDIRDVSYTYPGSNSGVTAVSLSVEPGTIYGLLGVNGAGKTTLMRLMVGLIAPDRGSISYFKESRWRREMLGSIGTLIETPSLYGHLTAREHLGVFARYTSASPGSVGQALEMTGISEVADRTIRHLSLGMKQRLGIAVALLHDPPILILDEPTNGLDPVGIVATREQLKRLAQEFGKTIVISSHLLGEIEKTATRIGIIHRGSMRFEGTSEELSERLGATSELRVRVSSTEAALRAVEDAGLSGRADGLSIIIDAGSDAAAAAALKAISSRGIEIYESAREARSLERDFLSLTGGDDDVR